MTDAELLEQVKMAKLWVEKSPAARRKKTVFWPWEWRTYRVINAFPVNQEYLMTILNRLEALLEERQQIKDA